VTQALELVGAVGSVIPRALRRFQAADTHSSARGLTGEWRHMAVHDSCGLVPVLQSQWGFFMVSDRAEVGRSTAGVTRRPVG
jgi:hypothetical protein